MNERQSPEEPLSLAEMRAILATTEEDEKRGLAAMDGGIKRLPGILYVDLLMSLKEEQPNPAMNREKWDMIRALAMVGLTTRLRVIAGVSEATK